VSGHAPSNEANRDASISSGIHFLLKPCFIAIASAENAKPTSSAHSLGKLPISDNIDRGKQKLDA
jgi:hypothetical protein